MGRFSHLAEGPADRRQRFNHTGRLFAAPLLLDCVWQSRTGDFQAFEIIRSEYLFAREGLPDPDSQNFVEKHARGTRFRQVIRLTTFWALPRGRCSGPLVPPVRQNSESLRASQPAHASVVLWPVLPRIRRWLAIVRWPRVLASVPMCCLTIKKCA